MAAPRYRPPPNPSGLCGCGCGGTTLLAKWNDVRTGAVAGQHLLYVFGHQVREHARSAGGLGKLGYGRYQSSHGYIFRRLTSLSAADRELADPMSTRYAGFPAVSESRLVMAQSLGRPLTDREQVHHRNGQRDDNRAENLELRVGAHGSGATHCRHCGHVL